VKAIAFHRDGEMKGMKLLKKKQMIAEIPDSYVPAQRKEIKRPYGR
jgi:hypothetical protein